MKSEFRQVVKLASPGELKAYVVYEHQLDLLSQGSPVSLLLANFGLFFLGMTITAFGTLATSPPAQDRVYYTFLIIAIITLIAGVVVLAIWYKMHKSSAKLVVEIKAQMPANPPIEQVTVADVDTEEVVEEVLHSSEEEEPEAME